MNTNLTNTDISKRFQLILEDKSNKERYKRKSFILMAEFLSEINKIAEVKGLKKKDLASMIGTSASFITQLFRGDRKLSFETVAKFEEALNISFRVEVENKDSNNKQIEILNELINEILHTKNKTGFVTYRPLDEPDYYNAEAIDERLINEHEKKEVA